MPKPSGAACQPIHVVRIGTHELIEVPAFVAAEGQPIGAYIH
jgi:hypothetical protein